MSTKLEQTVEDYVNNRLQTMRFDDKSKLWILLYRPNGVGNWIEKTSYNADELFLDMNVKRSWYEHKYYLTKFKDKLLQKIKLR